MNEKCGNDFELSVEENIIRHVHMIGRASFVRLDNNLESIGSSAAKMWALHQLHCAGRPLPLSGLAEAMGTGKSNATQTADRLEAEGLIARIPNAEDRRSVLIQVTDKGRIQYEQGSKIRTETAKSLFSALTDDEKEQLVALLGRMLAEVSAIEDC